MSLPSTGTPNQILVDGGVTYKWVGKWVRLFGATSSGGGGVVGIGSLDMGDVSGPVTLPLDTFDSSGRPIRAFSMNLTGNIELSLSGTGTLNAALREELKVDLTSNAYGVSWPAAFVGPSGLAPGISSDGSDSYEAHTHNAGVFWPFNRVVPRFNLTVPTFRYWGVRITANGGGGFVVITESEWRGEPGGPDLTSPATPVGVTVTAGDPTANITDNSNSYASFTANQMPGIYYVDLLTPKSVREVMLSSKVGDGNGPRNFTFVGTNNLSSWTDVKSVTGQTVWGSSDYVYPLI